MPKIVIGAIAALGFLAVGVPAVTHCSSCALAGGAATGVRGSHHTLLAMIDIDRTAARQVVADARRDGADVPCVALA